MCKYYSNFYLLNVFVNMLISVIYLSFYTGSMMLPWVHNSMEIDTLSKIRPMPDPYSRVK